MGMCAKHIENDGLVQGHGERQRDTGWERRKKERERGVRQEGRENTHSEGERERERGGERE